MALKVDRASDPCADPDISVIIPTRNEEQALPRTIRRARTCTAAEIIVVDGGSTDRTVAIARAMDATVICAAPGKRGRAAQQNAGAAAARGSVLVFLHADTLVPRGYGQQVRAVLARSDVILGAFGFRLDSRRWSLGLLERLVACRCRLLSLPYGDQGLFLRAADFRRLGGFCDIPAMEDFELVRRAGRLGRVVVADAKATTSARHWETSGLLRTTLTNQICVAAFLLGAAPDRIARWRRRLPRTR